MTFDEAIEVLANSENNKSVKEGQLEYGLYRAYDVVSVFQKLRKEYAPTIEMTKTEKNNILSSKKYGLSFINFYEDVMHQSTAIKFGTRTTPELYKSFSEEKLMQAWLHPETIKVVDE